MRGNCLAFAFIGSVIFWTGALVLLVAMAPRERLSDGIALVAYILLWLTGVAVTLAVLLTAWLATREKRRMR